MRRPFIGLDMTVQVIINLSTFLGYVNVKMVLKLSTSRTSTIGSISVNGWLINWLNVGVTPCRQLRPSSGREHTVITYYFINGTLNKLSITSKDTYTKLDQEDQNLIKIIRLFRKLPIEMYHVLNHMGAVAQVVRWLWLTKRAIIDVNSVVSGRNYDILTSNMTPARLFHSLTLPPPLTEAWPELGGGGGSAAGLGVVSWNSFSPRQQRRAPISNPFVWCRTLRGPLWKPHLRSSPTLK